LLFQVAVALPIQQARLTIATTPMMDPNDPRCRWHHELHPFSQGRPFLHLNCKLHRKWSYPPHLLMRLQWLHLHLLLWRHLWPLTQRPCHRRNKVRRHQRLKANPHSPPSAPLRHCPVKSARAIAMMTQIVLTVCSAFSAIEVPRFLFQAAAEPPIQQARLIIATTPTMDPNDPRCRWHHEPHPFSQGGPFLHRKCHLHLRQNRRRRLPPCRFRWLLLPLLQWHHAMLP
jgi:hypothetical protein